MTTTLPVFLKELSRVICRLRIPLTQVDCVIPFFLQHVLGWYKAVTCNPMLGNL